MKKHIITYYESSDPLSSYNIAAGFNVGQKWFNYITGIEYLHKSDGIWVSNTNSSSVLNYLPLSGGTLNGNLGINTVPSHQIDIINTSNQRTVYGINSIQTANVLQQDVYSTGYDETLINPWYGWKFTASGNHTMGSLSIRLKSVGIITNIDGYIRLRLFSDNGNQPTTLLYTSDLIRMGSVTSSYVEYLFGGDYTLTNGTIYWILVECSEPVTGGGSITIDRDSEALSTTTDGIIWEINSGLGGFVLYGQSPYAIYGFSTNQNPIFGRSINSSAVAGYSLNSNGIYGFSQNQGGIHGDSIYATGVYGGSINSEGVSGVSTHGRAASFYIGDGATKLAQDNNCSVLNAIRQSDGNSTFSVSGNILSLTDNPTNCSSVSGSLISGVIDSVERFNVNPRVIDNSNAVASFIDTKNTLIDISAKLLSLRNGGVEKAYFNPYGKLQLGTLSVGGDGDYATLLSLGGLYSNSPGYYPKIKFWDNGTNYFGLGVSANQYELMAPLHAHFSYIVNNTEKYRVDTDGSSIHKIGNYIYQSTDFSSDTINDIRVYVVSGVTINEICTVANATKGAGTWIQTINIDTFGNLTSNTFVKLGGTSMQFLMADGSTSTTGSTLSIYDSRYVNMTGGTMSGGLSINGTLNVYGDIIQSGTTWQTHANQIYSSGDTITLRDGAINALPISGYTGIVAKKYDGANDGVLVFDRNGVARVGDMDVVNWTGTTQAIATREDLPLSNGFAYWDSEAFKFNTKILVINDVNGLTNSLSNYLPLSGGTLSGIVKSPAYQDILGNIPFVAQNSGIIYHTFAWTTAGTVSTIGTTVTGVGTAFAATMVEVGAKIIINREERIITSYTSVTQVSINSAFSQSYSGASFGVYSKAFDVNTDGTINWYPSVGTKTLSMFAGGSLTTSDVLAFGSKIRLYDSIKLANNMPLLWSSTSGYSGTIDTGIIRLSDGVAQIYDGITSGAYRDLALRSIHSLSGSYQYNAASPTADIINDRRTLNNAGIQQFDRCTVANATKGSGTWITDLSIDASGTTVLSKIRPNSDSTTAVQFTKADGTTVVFNIDTSGARPIIRIGTTSVAGSSTPTVFSLGGSYSTTKGYYPKLKIYDDGTNYFGLGVSADCYELMAPLGAYFSFVINKLEKLAIGTDGSIIQPNSIYNYQGASQIADTVNDTRESSFSGEKIYEVCTVANATKGAGSWVVYKTIQLITRTDSNEIIGSGSYVDLISNKSGRGSIFFGDGAGYANFIFTSEAVVTFIYNSSNVFTSVQTGTNHVIVKDNGSNVRIINELGVTSNFHIEINYNQ